MCGPPPSPCPLWLYYTKAANKFGAALRDASGASVPRLELPEGVVSAMKDLDLKNPNQMSEVS